MNNNILTEIKTYLNISDSVDDYDQEIINIINISLFKMRDYGVPFIIQNVTPETTWSELVSEKYLHIIKSLLQIKCLLLFEPPQNATVYKNYKDEDMEITRRLIDYIEREK